MNEQRLQSVLEMFETYWQLNEDHPEPAFLLAGGVPDYSQRLPRDYWSCVPLGIHGGVRVVYYSPRQLEVDREAATITLLDGHLDIDQFDRGDPEFRVTIDAEDIVASRFLNRAGYEGPALHKLDRLATPNPR